MSRSLPSLAQASLMASNLGVGGRITHRQCAIAGSCQHLARGAHHHGADGDLARKAGSLGLGEGEIHGPLAWARHICKLSSSWAAKVREAGSQVKGRKPAPVKAAEPMRIAKAIAHAGLCSRRDAEKWIEQGRVAVNGTVLDHPGLCGQA